MPSATKFGVLSDLHFELHPTEQRGWIGNYDPIGLPTRIGEALEWFCDEEVELVILAGDIVETPTRESLEGVFDLLLSATLPIAMVCGNHDLHPENRTREQGRSRGVQLLDEFDGTDRSKIIGLTATTLEQNEDRFVAMANPQLRSSHAYQIVVSHFPILSEAERLADAGLPYPGNLINRRGLLKQLNASPNPIVVLSGHIHARTASSQGNVLQFGCGALIEPPHDAAIVTLSEQPLEACRAVRRLATQALPEPVFADDFERWTWIGNAWHLTESAN